MLIRFAITIEESRKVEKMKRKRNLKNFTKSDNAVSEILGTVILLAMAVALFSVLYLLVTSSLVTTSSPSVSLVGYVEGHSIVIEHLGGDSLDSDTTSIVVTIGGQDYTASINGDKLDIGERIVYSNGSITGVQVVVTVIDDSSNSALFIATLQEGATNVQRENWVQTNQTDFESGTLVNLNSSSSPGDVKLATDGNDIYAFRGNNNPDFWRYSISGNSWTSMTNAPESVRYGGALTYDGSNYVYAFQGNNNNPDFWRYSISGNSWTSMTDAPGDVKDGGALAITEDQYLSSGTLTSSIKDCNSAATITQVSWGETLNGQTITIQIRSDNDADMSSPSSWETVTNEDTTISTPANRYIQYKATLSTTDTSATPILHDVTIAYTEG